MRKLALSPLLLLAACATAPTGPSVLVLPGDGKSFEQFRVDDYACRDFALAQIGGKNANEAAINSGITSAAVGTAVGALAGAAIGGHNSAGVGAGVGLAAGSLAGTGAAQDTAGSAQERYNFAYEQCMYAKGNKIPVAGSRYGTSPRYTPPPPPPPSGYPPPPPPSATTPPPPPPR